MIEVLPFGVIDGQQIHEITLQNHQQMVVKCITYGCTITHIGVPDRDGIIENVVCGFSDVTQYAANPQYFGSAIGPFAGRLEQAVVEIDGKRIATTANEGAHLLHGGTDGFHAQVWSYEIGETADTSWVKFQLCRQYDNFPGNLNISITYTLSQNNQLTMHYHGYCNEPTLLNTANHSYFNLSGNLKRTILDHIVQVDSDKLMYIDEQGVPLATYVSMEDSPFQFDGCTIGEIIASNNIQIERASGGIDHPFILNRGVISLLDPISGRLLKITTDQQCVVIYSGQKIGSQFYFTEGQSRNFSGICLEVQNVPNSVMHRNLPSAKLLPGEKYTHTTHYHFSVQES